jgi:hypothetical protein
MCSFFACLGTINECIHFFFYIVTCQQLLLSAEEEEEDVLAELGPTLASAHRLMRRYGDEPLLVVEGLKPSDQR